MTLVNEDESLMNSTFVRLFINYFIVGTDCLYRRDAAASFKGFHL